MSKVSKPFSSDVTSSLRNVIDASPACMFWKDTERRFVGVNKAFLSYYGFTSESDLIGKTDEDIGWNEDAEGFKEVELEVLQKGVTRQIIGRCLCHGVYRSIQAEKSPLYDGDKIVGLVGVFQDISELIHYQRELKDARDKAEAANLAKSRFLSNMSHEIRTPLNAIVGLIEMQRHVLDDKDALLDYLEKAESASHMLLSVINDILDMSAIENHKMKLARDVFSLKELIYSITDIYYPLCKKKDITLATHCFNVIQELFIGDRLRIQQIILNLLSNALKFTPAGGSITFDIGQVRIDDAIMQLTLKIADTGCGMSSEFLNRIFGDFEQEDPTTVRKHGGSGLGLSITKNLVKLMGGTISVQSIQQKGSIFTLSIPLEYSPEQQAVYNKASLSSTYALFVCSDGTTLSYVSRILEKMGVRNDLCTTAKEALERCVNQNMQGDPYTYCLIDDELRDCDIKEFISDLRSKVPEETAITIFNSLIEYDLKKEGERMGITSYLAKPLFASSLYDSIVYHRDNRKQPTALKTTYDLSGMHILLIEDNELNTFIAKNLLEQYGATIDTAENGLIGCEKFINNPSGTYDAILMDIQMPIMDGYEATKRIRSCGCADSTSIPIIALTASVFTSDVSTCLAVGMNDHLSKPFQPQEIYDTLFKYRK